MATVTKTLYDADFALWAEETAKLLREGRFDEVDLEHVVEEIEDLSKSERRAVRSQLKRMLMHLIKQRIQPEHDGPSWRASIADAREELLDDLADSPSLRGYLQQRLQRTYEQAVNLAAAETGVRADLPSKCPYTLEELLK